MMSPETALRRICDRLGEGFRLTPDHEPSFWLRSRLVDLTCRGPLPTCGHPGLALVALWRPTVICADCAPALRLTGDDDFRCDRCGVVEHPIKLGMVACQGLLVSFGLCSACSAKEYGGGSR